MQLRGHHFLCILTFRGFGYTPAFVDNMTAIVADIAAGRPVHLVVGPDDICAALRPADRAACDHDCAREETRLLDKVAVAEIGTHLGMDFTTEIVIGPDRISKLRELFASGAIRGACRRCPWSEFCDRIAEEQFSATRLFPPWHAAGTG